MQELTSFINSCKMIIDLKQVQAVTSSSSGEYTELTLPGNNFQVKEDYASVIALVMKARSSK